MRFANTRVWGWSKLMPFLNTGFWNCFWVLMKQWIVHFKDVISFLDFFLDLISIEIFCLSSIGCEINQGSTIRIIINGLFNHYLISVNFIFYKLNTNYFLYKIKYIIILGELLFFKFLSYIKFNIKIK